MKVAIVADTHWGIKNDHVDLLESQERFFKETFWPKVDSEKVDFMIHLGDLFDRRKYVNFLTAKSCREVYYDEIIKRSDKSRFKCFQIIGNHDDYYRNTNDYNSPETTFGSSHAFDVVKEPKVVNFAGSFDFAVMPWVYDGVREGGDYKSVMNSKFSGPLFGHLEFKGFDMHRGQPSEHGMETDDFGKFDHVYSGHFHTRSTRGNVTYVGSTGQYTWADYDDVRGFHILDTETGRAEFVPNPNVDFEKFVINSRTTTEELKKNVSKSHFMKMIVSPGVDKSLVDDAVLVLEGAGVHDLQVIHEIYDDSSVVHEVEDAGEQDTLTLIESIIDSSECSDKDLAKDLVKSLYRQSQEML